MTDRKDSENSEDRSDPTLDQTEATALPARRKLLRVLAGAGGVVASGALLPEKWTQPVVNRVLIPAHAQATTTACVFVGSWAVSDGPNWSTNPPCYTGQEAAALLFGGNPSDYRISTVSDQAADINDSAWLDGWGDSNTYGSGSPAPHDFKIDADPPGYASPGGVGSSYSAYVADHGVSLLNYAFRNCP